jgi:hypothetical protein
MESLTESKATTGQVILTLTVTVNKGIIFILTSKKQFPTTFVFLSEGSNCFV